MVYQKELDQGFYVTIKYDVTYCETPIYNGSTAKRKEKDWDIYVFYGFYLPFCMQNQVIWKKRTLLY